MQFKNQLLANDIDTVQDCGIDDESVIELSKQKGQSSPSATPYEEPEELDEETKQVFIVLIGTPYTPFYGCPCVT